MNTNELNAYIKNYLENDRTNRAIMLDGPWGSGKSYYIKNNLSKALEKNGAGRCITVSLYGLKTLSDISVNIFLEAKLLFGHKIWRKIKQWIAETFNCDCNKGSIEKKSNPTGKIIAKTVVKGIASYFNVDVSLSDTDLGRLYKTVNLKDRLIILEDLERSSIDIIDVLGYVNSLVEQDGAKVLLVANEQEIINNLEKKIVKKETSIGKFLNNNGKPEEEGYKEKETYDYLRQKEKTIGDTIAFQSDISQTAEDIIKLKKYQSLECILNDEEVMKMIKYEMEQKTNFRSFIYACQKTNDIFNQYAEFSQKPLKDEFVKFVFVGVLRYVISKDSGEKEQKNTNKYINIEFDENILLSTYSIVPFAKEYIEVQQLDFKKVEKWEKLFEDHNITETNKQKEQEARTVIHSYYVSDKNNIMAALKTEEELLKQDQVLIKDYRVLVGYLFAIKWKLNDPEMNSVVLGCLDAILKNVDNVSDESIFLFLEETMWRNTSAEGAEKAEYNQFIDSLCQAIEKRRKKSFSTDYSIDDFSNFISILEEAQRIAYSSKVFGQKIDIKKLVDNLFTYTSAQIYQLRFVFKQVYNVSNWDMLLPMDERPLKDIKAGIIEGMRMHKDMELVQKYQMTLFVADLEGYLNKSHQ